MSDRSFGSLFMVASCAGAALGCYLVSLHVASERASLENVENQIVLAQRDLRVLQTEIGTRGRLSQLERWNAGAFALSAPAANQFLQGSFELARLTQPQHKVDFQAPVVLASAPAPAPARPPLGEPETDDSGAPAPAQPSALLHQASFKIETREVPARAVVATPRQTAPKSVDRPVTAAKPAIVQSTDKPGLAAAKTSTGKPRAAKSEAGKLSAARPARAQASATARPSPKKSVDKPAAVAARPMTKRTELAKADPLAPLPDTHRGKTKDLTSRR
jgi:hypothetical protein